MYYQFLENKKNYIINLQEHSIRISEKGFLQKEKELFFCLFDNNLDFNVPIKELTELKENSNCKELISSCEFIIDLLTKNDYYLYLFDKEISVHHLEFLLSELTYAPSYINGYYDCRNPEHELYEEVSEWRRIKTLEILNKIKYEDVFYCENDGLNNEFPYLSMIADSGFNEACDLIFGNENFEMHFNKACKEINFNLNVGDNIFTRLAKHPDIFNKYIHKFGDLSKYAFYGYRESREYNFLDNLLTCPENKLYELDTNSITPISPSDERICITYIYRNMRFVRYERNHRLKNLEAFFSYISTTEASIDLNVFFDEKYLLEYAVEDEDKEVTAILLKNGAKINIKKSNAIDDENTLLNEVKEKNRYYNWLIRQSKK